MRVFWLVALSAALHGAALFWSAGAPASRSSAPASAGSTAVFEVVETETAAPGERLPLERVQVAEARRVDVLRREVRSGVGRQGGATDRSASEGLPPGADEEEASEGQAQGAGASEGKANGSEAVEAGVQQAQVRSGEERGEGSVDEARGRQAMGPGATETPRSGGQRSVEADTAALHRALAEAARRCYPAAARRYRLQGEATVHFCVSRDGELTTTRLHRSSGEPLLDSAAQECVLPGAQPFPPGANDGCFTLPVRFSAETASRH